MSTNELDVPEYNKDGDNYYFTKQELEAFIAQDPSTHDALLQAAKKANQDQRITAGLDPATKPLDEQILRDIFNGNGLNYSQIVGDELTTVSMGLQDFNYSLKQVLALIATQVREAKLEELDNCLFRLASLIGCEPESEERHRKQLKEFIAQQVKEAQIQLLTDVWGDKSLDNDDVAENVRKQLATLKGDK